MISLQSISKSIVKGYGNTTHWSVVTNCTTLLLGKDDHIQLRNMTRYKWGKMRNLIFFSSCFFLIKGRCLDPNEQLERLNLSGNQICSFKVCLSGIIYFYLSVWIMSHLIAVNGLNIPLLKNNLIVLGCRMLPWIFTSSDKLALMIWHY